MNGGGFFNPHQQDSVLEPQINEVSHSSYCEEDDEQRSSDSRVHGDSEYESRQKHNQERNNKVNIRVSVCDDYDDENNNSFVDDEDSTPRGTL